MIKLIIAIIVAVGLCSFSIVAQTGDVSFGSHNASEVAFNETAIVVQADNPVEVIESRTRTSKTHYLGGNKYSLDISVGSLHYKDNPDDPEELWKDIDTTIVSSPKPNWDWEIVKGNWHLLIKDDTTVAVGKNGNWLGFQYQGFGYLDWATKDYHILQTRQNVAPIIDGNRIIWEDIFYETDLEYIYTPDGFKELLYISQATRDWLTANPPSSFGLDNQTSYLTGFIQCDWQSSFSAEDVFGVPINWDNANEFIDNGVFWRDPVKDKIITALPLGYAIHDEVDPDSYVKLRYRFFNHANGNHYLLFGAKVTDLNAYPAGTIVIDPTIDEQVDAGLDDAYEGDSTGAVSTGGVLIAHYSSVVSGTRYWGAYRWVNSDISQGDTIDVAYAELYAYDTDYDDIDLFWHFEDAASPAQFTSTDYDITDRTRTSASVNDDVDGVAVAWHQTPSLVTPLQEVVDDYSPTAFVLIGRPETTVSKFLRIRSHNGDSAEAAKLHIEYTAVAGGYPYSWGVIIG